MSDTFPPEKFDKEFWENWTFMSTDVPDDFVAEHAVGVPEGWDVNKELEKAAFYEHLYQCAGRANPEHPDHGHFTGLWYDFCLGEAGVFARDMFFERQRAMKRAQTHALENQC